MANHFNIYATTHQHSQVVCEAIQKGTGFNVVTPAPLREGGVIAYGFLRGLLPTLKQAQHERRAWVYVDRGYLRATLDGDYSGYFRLTRNAWQHDGSGNHDVSRWQALGLDIGKWRKGRHILICPPGEVFAQAIGGFSADSWLHGTLATLRGVTDRPIQVRQKAARDSRPLLEDLQGCHALVTYMSNTAVEAVLAGTPVFCLGPCAARSMGRSDLTQIEDPVYPEDRQRWAQSLAANQWTLDEVRAGKANHLFTRGNA